VFDKFISGYNSTVYSSTVMAPPVVPDKDLLHVWERMRKRESRMREV
jgi:hypothetical protein